MDSRPDADMMEAEPSPSAAAAAATTAPQFHTHTPPLLPALDTNQENVVRGLLTVARQLVDQGKPSQSLEAVVMAMKTIGGDEAVLRVLNRAREIYMNKVQENAAADELASLFAECAIAEALPSKSGLPETNIGGQLVDPDASGSSILAETGRKQIVLDAFSDRSSFVCLQCGGLVSNHRKEEHYAFWCCKI